MEDNQEKLKKLDKGFESRKLIRENNFGILSTISVDVEAYPFGSFTPYCLSDKLEPLFLLSNIAQHSKNIRENPKVSLTVFNPNSEDIQNSPRLTYIGDMKMIENDDYNERYLRYFPASKSYFEFHDFKLYRIELKRIRYIGGFGSIFWVEKEDYFQENQLAGVEKRIITHMNEDHQDSIIKYCRVFKKYNADSPKIAGIDPEGFDVVDANKYFRFLFDEPVNDANKAREVLVKMARINE